MFGLGKRKDPVCGMGEERGKGSVAEGKWFCSDTCRQAFAKAGKRKEKKGCC